jgi:hypothetical protein
MDLIAQADVIHYLGTRGFLLQELNPQRSRLDRQSDDSEIIILNPSTPIRVRIKTGEAVTDYTATDLEDLFRYLKETVE